MRTGLIFVLSAILPLVAHAAPGKGTYAEPIEVEPAKAEEGDPARSHPHSFSVSPGLQIPIGLSGITTGFAISGSYAYRLHPSYSMGLGYQYGTLGAGIDGVSVKASQLRVSGNYHCGSFFAGPHLGAVFESVSARTASASFSASETEFGMGLHFGTDALIAPQVSLGWEVDWTTVLGSPKTYHLLGLLIPIRFHF